MTNKMTKKDYFAILATMVENANPANKADMLAFINHEVELLEKKSTKSKQTKTQKENVEVMVKIKSALAEVGKPVTITELQGASATMAEYSNQKLSALLKKLVDTGKVIKTTEKKKSYFSLAVEVEDTAEDEGEGE